MEPIIQFALVWCESSGKKGLGGSDLDEKNTCAFDPMWKKITIAFMSKLRFESVKECVSTFFANLDQVWKKIENR